MRRTTVSLPEDLAEALDREVRLRHVTASELTREALTRHLGLVNDGPRKLPFAALGHSGHRTTGRDMEELLEQEWNDDPGSR